MKTFRNNLVIVCEGTDTEYLYFDELKNYVLAHAPGRYNAIKVVPVPEEIIQQKNPKRNHLTRKMADAPLYHYYCKYEASEADYKQYRAQPIRYVRETVLFMQEDGFTEGWAVFDNDKHPAHEDAFRYACEKHVGIGFSSYSFEEWLLAHFERCTTAFLRSECKENGKELRCGSLDALDGDCHGSRCIGGRLRSQGFIPDYSKNKQGLFGVYTLPLLRTAMINAAWLRRYSKGNLWDRNPYTDVDVLVARMLEATESYQWYGSGASFRHAGSEILVTIDGSEITLTNVGNSTLLLSENNSDFLNREMTSISSGGRILLQPGENGKVNIPRNAVAFVLKDVQRRSVVDLAG